MSDVQVQMMFYQCQMKCKRFCRRCDGLLHRILNVSLELSLLELTQRQGAIADLTFLSGPHEPKAVADRVVHVQEHHPFLMRQSNGFCGVEPCLVVKPVNGKIFEHLDSL
jgi:hypothetical protein